MQFHRDTTAEANLITGFGSDGIRVGELTLSRSCLVAVDTVIEDWPVSDINRLHADDLQVATALSPELILLGSGGSLVFPSPDIVQSVTVQGIGFEVMDTAAACRTYNVLVHEGRQVVAALIL